MHYWHILSHCPRRCISGILISWNFFKKCFFFIPLFKFQPRALFQGTQIPFPHQTAVELLTPPPPMLWFTPFPSSSCSSHTGGGGRWRDSFMLVAGTGGGFKVQICVVTFKILARTGSRQSHAGRLHHHTALPVHRTGNLPPGSTGEKGNFLFPIPILCLYT